MNRLLSFLICSAISTIAFGQTPFQEITFQSKPNTLVVPSGLSYKILFSEGDSIAVANGKWAKAKGGHDMTLVLPAKDGITTLVVSHECNDSSALLGDGGGLSLIPIKLKNNEWKLSEPIRNVDFTAVGGTYNNCSGTIVEGKNTILTAEEGTPENNKILSKHGRGYTDTSNFNGIPRYKNTGWMVEVDPKTTKALQKLYGMGRFVHESALVMEDGKTVYLTDDFAPSIFFKFVAEQKNDFSKGQLYAYKEAVPKDTSHWIKLPMKADSLVQIREVALRMGATYFLRMEWMTKANGNIYITETGFDGFLAEPEKVFNGKAAKHLHAYTVKPGFIDHPYGSVLIFDPVSNEITPLLHGGSGSKHSDKHLSNPDAITTVEKNGKTYLIIHEDIFNSNRGRASDAALMNKETVNEIYWLDLSIAKPSVDDLQRFVTAPVGAETSGGTFIKGDSRYYFFNIQHPSRSNPAPFNRSCTVVIDLGK